jgi:hypothetical protein
VGHDGPRMGSDGATAGGGRLEIEASRNHASVELTRKLDRMERARRGDTRRGGLREQCARGAYTRGGHARGG